MTLPFTLYEVREEDLSPTLGEGCLYRVWFTRFRSELFGGRVANLENGNVLARRLLYF